LGGDYLAKALRNLVSTWGTVILFLVGLILLALAAFLFNVIVGLLVSGLQLCLMAYVIDREQEKGGD
jgi:hypothetical protein